MSPLQESLVISGSIFALVVYSSYGRRAYSPKALARPLIVSAIVGYGYLKGAPTSAVDLVVYAVGIAVGIGFALLSNAVTKVERDTTTGEVVTVTGLAFVGAWLLAMGVRVAFIALSEHNQTFRLHLGQFMMSHQIVESAIAPFFVAMALTTVLARLGLVALRVKRVEKAPVAERAMVSA